MFPKVDVTSTAVLASVDVAKIRRIVDDASHLGEHIESFGPVARTVMDDETKT